MHEEASLSPTTLSQVRPMSPSIPVSGLVFSFPASHPQQLFRQVPPIVDAAVHGDEPLDGRLVADVGIVETGVEHDHRKGEDVAGI